MYLQHIKTLCEYAEKALKQSAAHGEIFDGIVFHAGSDMNYHADDHPVVFHTVAHFGRWVPLKGANHFVHFESGQKPRLIQYIPEDYWYEAPDMPNLPLEEAFELIQVSTLDEIKDALGFVANCAYIGNNPDLVLDLGIFEPGIEPPYLMAALDWFRGYKTPYEVDCLQKAAQLAANGYTKITEMLPSNPSEFQVHLAYLGATEHLELEMPYHPIMGWNNNAAVLHYQSKSRQNPQNPHTLLIDAGAAYNGYAIDITRTYLVGDVNPTFAKLHQAIDKLTQEIAEKCVHGSSFQQLHVEAHQAIAMALCNAKVLKTSPEEAFTDGLTRAFYPHGLGHHLGLQVHDIGGFQIDVKGTEQEPDDLYPSLRTTRPVEKGNVLTIEPGIYFIEILLAPYRAATDERFNWTLIDELLPLGGIRVEDCIVVGETQNENLTRPLVPQPTYV